MKAKVAITKSFDEGKEFSKEWAQNDFEEFFIEEGQYLDRLCNTMTEHGKKDESFTMTYTVTVTM